MTPCSTALFPLAGEEEADEKAREDELGRGRDAATTVPAVEAVAGKELAAPGPWKTYHVLDVRTGRRQRTTHRRIQRSAHGGEKEHSRDTRADLEAAVADVLVRHPVAS